jgi:hypothetical protein
MSENMQAELKSLDAQIAELREYRNTETVRAMSPGRRTQLSQEQIALEEKANAIRTFLEDEGVSEPVEFDAEPELEDDLQDVTVEDLEIVPEEDAIEVTADDLEAADLTEEQA